MASRKKKKSKAEKLVEAKELVGKLFPGQAQVDLSKVYVKKSALSRSWNLILDLSEDIGLNNLPLTYIPAKKFSGAKHYNLSEEEFLQKDFEVINEDTSVFHGTDIIRLLDRLRSELGADPEKVLVMGTLNESYEVVAVEPILESALDKCIRHLRKSVAENEKDEKEEAENVESMAQRRKLMKLVEKLGTEKALALLEERQRGRKKKTVG